MTAEHAKKDDSVFSVALNLTVACIVAGIIISIVYFFTADIALATQAKLNQEALESLVTDADEYAPVDGKEGWNTASKDGELVAYIVPAENKGYGGPIKLLVAVAPDHTVIKYTVLETKETPGLGDKAEKEPFTDQFPGKTSSQLEVTKDAGNTENIQAISGATITTKAVTSAVKMAVDEVTEFTEGGK